MADNKGLNPIDRKERRQRVLEQTDKASILIDKLINRQEGRNLSPSFRSLLEQYFEQLPILEPNVDPGYYESLLPGLVLGAQNLSVLESISEEKKNIVIVGRNGSGKSTFVNQLTNSGLSNLVVLPAQKVLFFESNLYRRNDVNVKSYLEENQKSVNLDFKQDGIQVDKLVKPFTLLLTALIKDLARQSTEERQKDVKDRQPSKWDKVVEIWTKIIPDIKFIEDPDDRKPIPVKNYKEYSINELSDGEKSILFYIGNVIMAKEESYIVIDEPETFLNPDSYNRLWDELIKARPDCQFIFASHTIDFIAARRNISLFWCKSFLPPTTIELVRVDSNDSLPESLITELVGSTRDILFCEGKKNSRDYQVYSNVFSDFTVLPVDSHDNVVTYTKAINQSAVFNDTRAFGIVDGDALTEAEREKLNSIAVFVLPYNEIEMLLLSQYVVRNVLESKTDKNEIDNKLKVVKEAVLRKISDEKESIIYDLTKKTVDNKLRQSFIHSKNAKNLTSLTAEVDEIPGAIKTSEIIKRVTEDVTSALTTDSYEKALKISTLKQILFSEIADVKIMKGYAQFAIDRIAISATLQKNLREEILDFNHVPSLKETAAESNRFFQ
nr:AAA family ATPase [Lacticaseibacillus saniviri]